MPGLSDDPEAEFIPGTLGTASGMNLTVRLTVFIDQPFRMSGETICDAVCLPLDVPNFIIINHQIRLNGEKAFVIYV